MNKWMDERTEHTQGLFSTISFTLCLQRHPLISRFSCCLISRYSSSQLTKQWAPAVCREGATQGTGGTKVHRPWNWQGANVQGQGYCLSIYCLLPISRGTSFSPTSLAFCLLTSFSPPTSCFGLQGTLKPKYISLISMCFPLVSLPQKGKAFSWTLLPRDRKRSGKDRSLRWPPVRQTNHIGLKLAFVGAGGRT